MSLSVKDILDLCEGLRARGCYEFESPECSFKLSPLPFAEEPTRQKPVPGDVDGPEDPEEVLYWSSR